jgi:2-methylisocitrate lyase-like PEP mutase family enzyme
MEKTFRQLHDSGILMLPNAWDAGTARLIENLGAAAIATTSAGLAWSLGYADGGALPIDPLVGAVRAIARVLSVPLSVDIENGYSDDPAAVGALVAAIIDAGAVGINIEDGAASPEVTCAKIAAARTCATDSDVDLFVNLRTDVYLRNLAPPDSAVAEVIRRALLYRAAGCDGLFVPGLRKTADIRTIAEAIHPLPLSIMLVPALPPVTELAAIGVRRLSAGSAIAQAVFGHTRTLATDFLSLRIEDVVGTPMGYAQINQLFEGR